MINENADRMYGLDILRIMAMGVIFIGHSANQFGCNYYYFEPLIELRSAAMSLFFMLSGYVIYNTYHNKDMSGCNEIKNFYIKRCVSIIPVYYFISAIYIIFIGNDTYLDVVKLLPIELFGLQTTVSSLFEFSHNGGTWFVSCLLICYFFYPYIQQLLNMLTVKINAVICILMIAFMIYIPFAISWFGLLSIYENPFYRGLEFVLGCILSAIMCEVKNGGENGRDNFNKKSKLAWCIFFISSLIFMIVRYSNIIILGRIGYEVLCYPLLCCMLISGAMIGAGVFNKIRFVRSFIVYMSGIAYEFFLAQFFVWKISAYVMDFFCINGNLYKILISFFICLCIGSLLHYFIGKPISNYIKKRALKG